MLQGATGHKTLALFDPAGRPLAIAYDFGERRQAIVGWTGATMVLRPDPATVDSDAGIFTIADGTTLFFSDDIGFGTTCRSPSATRGSRWRT